MLGFHTKPLAQKLGYKSGYQVMLFQAPDHYVELLQLPEAVSFTESAEPTSLDLIHLFLKESAELVPTVSRHMPLLKKNGQLWVSWPKGTSKIKTDLSRDPIRLAVLELGLVDVKVASVDQDWSGLKFVYRSKDR